MAETDPIDRATAAAKIEINLSRLAQLFNSLDPPPFHERDLDQDAKEYMVSSAKEIPRQRPLDLGEAISRKKPLAVASRCLGVTTVSSSRS
jgi:hypothetical protein